MIRCFRNYSFAILGAMTMRIGYRIFIGFLAMVGITVIFSLCGIDAWWVRIWYGSAASKVFGLAGFIGFFMPFMLWAVLLIVGYAWNRSLWKYAAWGSAAAGTVGWIASSALKFFTGRPGLHAGANLREWSQTFQFGLGKGGIFWGWPSSHTTVAVAMSVALAVMFKEKKWVGILAIAYAAYIAIGATGFHWASDVIAGAILGTGIGIGVGNIVIEKQKRGLTKK